MTFWVNCSAFGHQLAQSLIPAGCKAPGSRQLRPAGDLVRPDAPRQQDYLDLARWVATELGLKLSGFQRPLTRPGGIARPLKSSPMLPVASRSNWNWVAGLGGDQPTATRFRVPPLPIESPPCGIPRYARFPAASEIHRSLLRAGNARPNRQQPRPRRPTNLSATNLPPLIPRRGEIDPTRPTGRAAELVHRAQNCSAGDQRQGGKPADHASAAEPSSDVEAKPAHGRPGSPPAGRPSDRRSSVCQPTTLGERVSVAGTFNNWSLRPTRCG